MAVNRTGGVASFFPRQQVHNRSYQLLGAAGKTSEMEREVAEASGGRDSSGGKKEPSLVAISEVRKPPA